MANLEKFLEELKLYGTPKLMPEQKPNTRKNGGR
jgi:hypothetical protein